MTSSSSPKGGTSLRRRIPSSKSQETPSEETENRGSEKSLVPTQDGKQGMILTLFVLSSTIVVTYFARNFVVSRDNPPERANKGAATPKNPEREQHDSCRIYMAPSSVKGVRGYGVYTTEKISKGDFFLTAPDGPDILVTDFDYIPRVDPLLLERRSWISVFDSYWWGRGVADQITYESRSSMDFQITFGSLPNHHCVLASVDHMWPNPPYDDTLVSRNDPGAGAFSYHMGRMFFSMRDLDAGDEMFLNYGYCGEDEENSGDEEETEEAAAFEPEWTSGIPKTPDFELASQITTSIYRRLDHRRNSKQTILDSLFNELYRKMVDDRKDSMTEQALSLIPKSSKDLFRIMEMRKSDRKTEIMRTLAKNAGMQSRSVEWIVENGLCLENLIPGKSKIPQAGQGAIAKFPLLKNELIVPAPLLQIVDRAVLFTLDDTGQRAGTQLLMNYCFGHKDSSVLLCPDTNVILINHCSTRTKECNPSGPNAEIRWATDWEKDNEKWLQMSVKDLGEQTGRGLAFDIIATRDIQPGEEVFIDYGESWENAWAAHVKSWNERHTRIETGFSSIKELNDQNTGPLPLLVSGDLRQRSDHRYLFTGCAYWYSEEDDEAQYFQENPNWTDLSDEQILQLYSSDGGQFQTNYTRHEDGAFWPCTVIRAEDDHGTKYTVRIDQAPFEDQLPWDEHNLPRFLTNFSRSSIHYFRQPYTSDQHLPHAFRHSIGIPDELFPSQWRNRRSEKLEGYQ